MLPLPHHRRRQKKLAKRTYLDSDAYALSRHHYRGICRVPPSPNYSQAEIDAMSSPIPEHRRELLHRVLLVIFLVVTVLILVVVVTVLILVHFYWHWARLRIKAGRARLEGATEGKALILCGGLADDEVVVVTLVEWLNFLPGLAFVCVLKAEAAGPSATLHRNSGRFTRIVREDRGHEDWLPGRG